MSGENFQRYVCWDPARAPEVIRVDAGSLSRSALLAVHRRFELSDDPEVEALFSDEDLLHAFREPGKSLTIISLIGDAGAGKSHLVQWLRARLIAEPNALIVYLPRNLTGLRGLLECLIEGLQVAGAATEAAELREQLGRAFSQDVKDFPKQLLDAMALWLEKVEVDPQGVARAEARRVGIARNLAHLLHDPTSRSWLLAEGRAIDRFVQQQSSFDPQSEQEVKFEESDLPSPLSLGDALNELSGPAQKALKEIHTAVGREFMPLEEAVRLLNKALVEAIPKVIGLTGERTLASVLEAARRTLLERGQELFLFIEDLARLQGVDLELLNAIITPAEEGGRQVRCTIRVAIAVTSGYYARLPETVRERGTSFDLTKRAVAQLALEHELEQFAARYLRALRASADEIEQSLNSAPEENVVTGSWVPNRCTSCEHRAECHTAFGEVDGVGLYPLNRVALNRMAHSAFREDSANGSFNPRRLLQRVLLRVTDASSTGELRRDQFPSKRLQELFTERIALSGDVVLAVDQLPQSARRQSLTQFWGGGELGYAERTGVATAFGLDAAGIEPAVGDPQRPLPPPTGAVPATKPVERSGVEQWYNGGALPNADAQNIREDLFEATKRLVPWGALGLLPDHPYMVGVRHAGLANVLRSFSFYIEGQLGDATEPDAATLVRRTIKRTDGNLLLAIDQGQRHGSAFRTGLDTYCQIQDFVESAADETTQFIDQLLWRNDAGKPPQSLVSRLVSGSLVSGAGSADDCVGLAVNSINDQLIVQGPSVSAEWTLLKQELAEHRAQLASNLLDFNSYRQGPRASRSLARVGRLTEHVERFLASWAFPSGRTADYADQQIKDSLSLIRLRDIDAALEREREAIQSEVEAASSLLGADAWDPERVAQAVADALHAATVAGVNFGEVQAGERLVRDLRSLALPPKLVAPTSEGSRHAQLAATAEVHASGQLQALSVLKDAGRFLLRAIELVDAQLLSADGPGATGQRACHDAVEDARKFLEGIA